MCFGGGSQKQYKPAAAPAVPLPPPDQPDIGESRVAENVANFGKQDPTYRVRGERSGIQMKKGK